MPKIVFCFRFGMNASIGGTIKYLSFIRSRKEEREKPYSLYDLVPKSSLLIFKEIPYI